jgi:hypothetical protein
MDLGATASIFAVVSLAGQLGGGVANLLTFFESFKGAPEYVHGIEKDLKLLLPILKGISLTTQRTTIYCKTATQRSTTFKT